MQIRWINNIIYIYLCVNMLYIVYYINTYVFIMCDVNVFKRDIQTVTEREKFCKDKESKTESQECYVR